MSDEKLKLEAQLALDKLWAKNLVPFKLTAHRVESIGSDEFIIRFNDSRLSSVDVTWRDGESFEDAVRAAVTSRVQRLDDRNAIFRVSRSQNASP